MLWPTAGVAFGVVAGQVARWDGIRWARTTGGPGAQTVAIEDSRRPRRAAGRLFAATDFAVFVSQDLGDTWEDGSLGLPKRPHLWGGAAAAAAAMATGWGVWRARVDLVVEVVMPEMDGEQVKILFGVIQGGGGLVATPHGPVPVGPDGPAFDAVLWAAAAGLAAQIGGDAGEQVHMIARVMPCSQSRPCMGRRR